MRKVWEVPRDTPTPSANFIIETFKEQDGYVFFTCLRNTSRS